MKKTKNKPKEGDILIDNEKLWAISSYFIFFLPMIFVKTRSNFLNYHINQAIILLAVSMAGQFGFGIIPNWIGFIPGQIFNLLMLVCLTIGIINVFNKEMKPLPVIGKLFTFIK